MPFKLPSLVIDIVYAGVVILGAIILNKLIYRIFLKRWEKKWGPHQAVLIKKLISYGVYIVAFIWILGIFGVSLGSVLTALGLFTVAVGFAAQTSVSNLISGIFLLFDRPFLIGDAVDIDGQVGVVLSIDLLSTKMRTFDNIFIRIPNEVVLKSVIKNLSKFDIRRINVEVGISYAEDITKAKEAIMDFLRKSPLVLAEPEPIVMTSSLGDSSVNLKVMAWIRRVDYIKAIDGLTQGVKEALDRAGIEIPFPQIVVHYADEEVKDEERT